MVQGHQWFSNQEINVKYHRYVINFWMLNGLKPSWIWNDLNERKRLLLMKNNRVNNKLYEYNGNLITKLRICKNI